MTNKNNNYLKYFSAFAKGEKTEQKSRKGCIIYTRVSTKDQADNGMSLATQKKYCEAFAVNNKIPIVKYFGGTYESAKTDERNEFVKMLDFIRHHRKEVSMILVYSFDRFSRTGSNAIYLREKLLNQGVEIVSVSQPGDSHTAVGKFQQSMQIFIAEMDNQIRREKSVTGMKEALLRGEWPNMPPFGYDILRDGKNRQIVVNKEGEKLRKVFYWIAKNNISQTEAKKRLSEFGIKLQKQRISKILRNPFYCGLLAHNLLEGRIVHGLHEKLIPESIFIKVNQILDGNPHGFQIQKENEFVPLKNFLQCANCNLPMSGYQVKAKKIWYYKCRTISCCNNISAKHIHDEFRKLLKPIQLEFSEELTMTMKDIILNNLNDLIQHNKDEVLILKDQLKQELLKLDKLEEKFINDEIDREMYNKHKPKYEEQINHIEKRLNATQIKSSNLEKMVSNAINLTSNILQLWELGDYKTKTKIQKFVYPGGIQFNKKKMEVRTTEKNELILLLLKYGKTYQDSEIEKNLNLEEKSRLVDPKGVEPPTF